VFKYNIRNSFFVGLFFVLISCAYAAEPLPSELGDVGIDEKIGQTLPMDLSLIDSDGRAVSLNALFGEVPVVLSFVYYSCPMLCHFITDGLAGVMLGSKLKLGRDYHVLTVSFDPEDTVESAQHFQSRYRLRVSDDAGNWGFFLADAETIKRLTASAGFKFKYDTKSEEYLHGACVLVLSPSGKISRYLYGINWTPFDFNLAISEAKQNSSRSTVERVMLFCYNYDPDSRGYVLYARNVMKIAGGLTVFGIIFLIAYLLLKERKSHSL